MSTDESQDSKFQGLSVRRQKRWLSKKRKVEAFIDLISTDDSESKSKMAKMDTTKKGSSGMQEDLNHIIKLNALLRKKLNDVEPRICLSEQGIKAQINLKFNNKDKPSGATDAPLFVEDVQHLLLKAMLGNISTVSPRWCKLIHENQISHVVLFVMGGLSKDSIVKNVNHLSKLLDTFNHIFEVTTPDSYSLKFATELSGVHLSLGQRTKQPQDTDLVTCNTFKPLSTLFPTEKDDKLEPTKSYSKLNLLLSPIQLVMEGFPLPKSVFEASKSEGYCFTKTVYSHVTADSPLYALDCEMCKMESGRMEVTRIAIIDEQLNVVYHTLVKPQGIVIDYLTKFSGVTEEMLEPVETTLEDVQRHIESILPANAILCGQSLNFDLHALKMIHPYVIDTSVIFNISGSRMKKSRLRVLSQMFLRENIQCGEKGHNPIEDCVAAMKLVKLKLTNGPQYGDAILMGHKIRDPYPVNSGESTRSHFTTSFFWKISGEKKTVCIIANDQVQQLYSEECTPSTLKRVVKTNSKRVVKHASNVMEKYDFTICHIDCESVKQNEEFFLCLDGYIEKLHLACPEKTLFIAVAPGLGKKNKNEEYENALCMVNIKKIVR